MKQFPISNNLQELTAHRTVELPVACYKTTVHDHVQGYIPLHWHIEFQFIVVLREKVRFFIQEETIVVRAGDGLFINSGVLHAAYDDDEDGVAQYICMNVSPHFVVPRELYMKYVYPYVEAVARPFVHLDQTQVWAQTILQNSVTVYEQVEQQSTFYELCIAERIQESWRLLIENGLVMTPDTKEALRHARMKQMLQWIHEHYTEKITLDAIARAGNLSRSEGCRYFQRILRESPMQYVLKYRLQQSLYYLQQDELSVTDVALEVGFTSVSYYIEKFKVQYGKTPLQYRKEGSG